MEESEVCSLNRESAAKYDRQIRLWGKSGQESLAKAHIVVLGATLSSIECLKNLVLSGINSFVLVDERCVSESNLVNNFFLQQEDLQNKKNIADACITYLSTLNPMVNATVFNGKIEQWAHLFFSLLSLADADKLKTGKVNPVTAIPDVLVTTSRCWERDSETGFCLMDLIIENCKKKMITHLHAEVHGLVGYMAPESLNDFFFDEDTTFARVEDLRILTPFPELRVWMEQHNPLDATQFNLQNPDDVESYHNLPYLCFIYFAYQQWKAAQEENSSGASSTSPPLNAKAYAEIRERIMKMHLDAIDKSNSLLEAEEKCACLLNRPYKLHSTNKPLFNDKRSHEPSLAVIEFIVNGINLENGKNAVKLSIQDLDIASLPVEQIFHALQHRSVLSWFVLYGMRRFRETSDPPGYYPFSGYVPDFSTTTVWYNELRRIYQAKHERDIEKVFTLALEKVMSDFDCLSRLSMDWQCRLSDLLRTVSKKAVKGVWDVCLSSYQNPLKPAIDVSLDENTHSIMISWQSSKEPTDPKKVPISFSLATTLLNFLKLIDLSDSQSRQKLLAAALLVSQLFHFEMESCACQTSSHSMDDFFHPDFFFQMGSKILWIAVEVDSIKPSHALSENDMPSDLATYLGNKLSWWPSISDPFKLACREIRRMFTLEIPSVSAVIGAVVSQEAIKHIHKQRLPCGNPILYDGYSNFFCLLSNPISNMNGY